MKNLKQWWARRKICILEKKVQQVEDMLTENEGIFAEVGTLVEVLPDSDFSNESANKTIALVKLKHHYNRLLTKYLRVLNESVNTPEGMGRE